MIGKNYKGARRRLVAYMGPRAKSLYVYRQRRMLQYRNHEWQEKNARNKIHTRGPVGCIVIICTKDKVACKRDEKSEDSSSQEFAALS